MSQNDGGPAFPWGGNVTGGASLRDYFAAKALQGFAADSTMEMGANDIAKLAYRWADAMLEARQAPQGGKL